MKFEERVGRSAVIHPVQCFKYLLLLFSIYYKLVQDEGEVERRLPHRDNIGVTHDGVGQRECKDDLESERCHVAVYRDFL